MVTFQAPGTIWNTSKWKHLALKTENKASRGGNSGKDGTRKKENGRESGGGQFRPQNLSQRK